MSPDQNKCLHCSFIKIRSFVGFFFFFTSADITVDVLALAVDLTCFLCDLLVDVNPHDFSASCKTHLPFPSLLLPKFKSVVVDVEIALSAT